MTNQIEEAIVALIKQHQPEIDYAILGDRILDRVFEHVCDNIDHDAIKDRVVDSLANEIDASDIANNVNPHDIACEISYDDLANSIDYSELAGQLDEDQLISNITDDVMRKTRDHIARLEQRIAMLENERRSEKLEAWKEANATPPAQPQPQPQPSTPFDMIERAKNLLADALGMLNNPNNRTPGA